MPQRVGASAGILLSNSRFHFLTNREKNEETQQSTERRANANATTMGAV
jgi:hypothetical protein